jgi:TetR/AcrR family fatty acid metabolism transcriptional regulator
MAISITDRQFEIIEAAGKILTASGVGGLTIKNLAKEMDFSESAIYRHFSSKEDIILYMLNYLAESMDERYAKAIKADLTASEKLRKLFQNQFSFFKTKPHFAVAVFSDGLMEESEGINKAILKIMDVKIKHLKPIVIEGQQNGTFIHSITSDEIIHVIMGAVRLHMFKWRLDNFKFELERKGENLIASVLKLIENRAQ